MAEVHYMSQDGLDNLKKDLAEALAQRPVISAAIAEAREKGDLSENAEYQYAKDEQRQLMQKQTLMQADLEAVKPSDFSDATTDEADADGNMKY